MTVDQILRASVLDVYFHEVCDHCTAGKLEPEKEHKRQATLRNDAKTAEKLKGQEAARNRKLKMDSQSNKSINQSELPKTAHKQDGGSFRQSRQNAPLQQYVQSCVLLIVFVSTLCRPKSSSEVQVPKKLVLS